MPVLTFLTLMILSQLSPTGYTDKMFRKAIDNDTTSPNYVLITVRDGNTKKSRQVCTTTNFLRGAVHKELGLSYSQADQQRVREIILSDSNHIFVFFKYEALKNIETRYTEGQLQEVRNLLRSKTNQQLIKRFDFQLLCKKLAAEKPAGIDAFDAYNDAAAHVLLERGILCGEGDLTGSIYIDEQ